jgi:hypothetical protein
MKRILILSLFLGLAHIGFSQQYKNVVKTNPIGLAFGNINVTWEHATNEKSSILFGANFLFQVFGVDVTSIGADFGYRYYFTHSKVEVPSGFNIYPQVGLNYTSFPDVSDVNATLLGIGFTVGYQWAWDSGFALDLGLGPIYRVFLGEVDDVDIDASGVWPRIIIGIGYAF